VLVKVEVLVEKREVVVDQVRRGTQADESARNESIAAMAPQEGYVQDQAEGRQPGMRISPSKLKVQETTVAKEVLEGRMDSEWEPAATAEMGPLRRKRHAAREEQASMEHRKTVPSAKAFFSG